MNGRGFMPERAIGRSLDDLADEDGQVWCRWCKRQMSRNQLSRRMQHLLAEGHRTETTVLCGDQECAQRESVAGRQARQQQQQQQKGKGKGAGQPVNLRPPRAGPYDRPPPAVQADPYERYINEQEEAYNHYRPPQPYYQQPTHMPPMPMHAEPRPSNTDPRRDALKRIFSGISDLMDQ